MRCADQRGGGRRLGHHRHAGEERAGRLLGEPPGGEVEGVDVHGDAVAGDQHVGPEARGAAERTPSPSARKRAVAELLAEPGVVGEGAAAAGDESKAPSPRVVPVLRRERSRKPSRCSRQHLRQPLEQLPAHRT